jgi:tetratricopeptide (TPR) repeat protein
VIAFPLAAMLLAVIHGSGIEWNDSSLRKGTVAGVVGLHVHWLAAGGVAFPSLMMALWGLLGAASLPSTSKMRFSFWGHTAFVIVLAGITLGYAFSLLVPRIERDLAAEKARTIEEDLNRSQPRNPSTVTPQIWTRLVPLMEQWANACREAAEKVPGDRQGWERLAAAEMSRMRLAAQLRSKNEARSYRAAVKAWEQAIALDPRRSETHRQLGALYHEAAGSGLDADASNLAAEEYRLAVELYPNSALRRWELGNILSEQNKRTEALTEFKRALELDKTPHLDKRLTNIQRKVAEKYIAGKP